MPDLAPAWKRAAFRLGLAVLPRVVRHSMGMWRWEEILTDDRDAYWSTLYDELDRRVLNQAPTPVERLLAHGIAPPATTVPWPKRFSILSRETAEAYKFFQQHGLFASPSWGNYWARIPRRELDAWLQVWASHPKGQMPRDKALAGLVVIGDHQAVEFLVKAGASPNAITPEGTPMRLFWGSPRMRADNFALTWRALNAGAIKPNWELWLHQPLARPRSREVLETLEGAPNLPSGEAALAFAKAMVQMGISGDGMSQSQALEAFKWWREHGQLELALDANARLLHAWVSTATPTSLASDPKEALRWFQALVDHGPVPPLPDQSKTAEEPAWAHVLARSAGVLALPEAVVQALLAPEHLPMEVNEQGQTPAQVLLGRWEAANRVQDSAFMKRYGFIKSHAAGLHLEQSLPPVDPEPEVASKPRPRL